MANRDAPFGFKPIKNGSGSPWNGETNTYYVPSSDGDAIYVGDLVKLAGSADANGIPTVTRISSAGDVSCGVMIGIEVNQDDLTILYREADTAMYVLVCDDPGVILEAQIDDDAAVTAADIGRNISPTVSTGSTTTGISGEEIDEDTNDTTNTLMFHLLRMSQYPNNSLGENAIMQVRFNIHQFAQTTGTTGI